MDRMYTTPRRWRTYTSRGEGGFFGWIEFWRGSGSGKAETVEI